METIGNQSDYSKDKPEVDSNKNTTEKPKLKSNEEPMDLTNVNKPQNAIIFNCHINQATYGDNDNVQNRNVANMIEMHNYILTNAAKKKRGRKRKSPVFTQEDQQGAIQHDNENGTENTSNCTQTILTTTTDSVQNVNSKESEVLKAAKSLFSKRTQTLFHWLYPSTPKSLLKTAVAFSWDTLGAEEKEFYVSQVLGRFGFPQSNLMINPQLGGIHLQSTLLPPPNLTLQNYVRAQQENHVEIANVMEPQQIVECQKYAATGKKVKRKTGKIGRPAKCNKNTDNNQMDDSNLLRRTQSESHEELFRDDPELCREFAQLKWSLNLN